MLFFGEQVDLKLSSCVLSLKSTFIVRFHYPWMSIAGKFPFIFSLYVRSL